MSGVDNVSLSTKIIQYKSSSHSGNDYASSPGYLAVILSAYALHVYFV